MGQGEEKYKDRDRFEEYLNISWMSEKNITIAKRHKLKVIFPKGNTTCSLPEI